MGGEADRVVFLGRRKLTGSLKVGEIQHRLCENGSRCLLDVDVFPNRTFHLRFDFPQPSSPSGFAWALSWDTAEQQSRSLDSPQDGHGRVTIRSK